MAIYTLDWTEQPPADIRGGAITIGNFDGVHLGHAALVAEFIRLHAEAKHTAPGSDFGADMTGRQTIADYFRKNVFTSFSKVDFDVVHLWEDHGESLLAHLLGGLLAVTQGLSNPVGHLARDLDSLHDLAQ